MWITASNSIKKHYEGDYSNVLQTNTSLQIIEQYLNDQEYNAYLLPTIPNSTSLERLHKGKKGKVKLFNTSAKRIAPLVSINKKITTYGLKDTWTNIGLDMDIDIRKIS